MPETISFIDANNHVQNVSPANPLPTTGGGGGGGGGASLADTLMEDNNGVLFIIRDSGTALTYIKVSDGTSFTPATPIQVAYSANIATAANQTTGNTSLAALVTGQGTQATAANQTTGNTSLAALVTGQGTQATAANQTTGNTSLATIATNTGALPSGAATAANQSTQITNEGADNTGVAQPSSGSGLRGWLSAIYKQLIAGVSTSALSLSAALASDQQVLPVNADPAQILTQPTSNSMAALNAAAAWTVEGGCAYMLSLTNSPGATTAWVGTVTFQVSTNSGSNWSTINGVPLAGPTAQVVNSSTAVGLWMLNPPNGAANTVLVRAILTSYTSGTVYADLVSVGQQGGVVLLPWTYTVTSGTTLVGPLNVSGMSAIDIQISAVTTTVLTAQGTNDPSLTTWDTLGVVLANGTAAAQGTITAAGTYRISAGGFKFVRIQCTTTGTVLTVQGVSARIGFPVVPGTVQNLAQIGGVAVSQATSQLGINLVNVGGAAVAAATAQFGINVVNLGGTAAAASIANGSTNKVLGISQATAVSQTDVSAGAFAGAGSVLGTMIASAQGGGGVVSAEINMVALTLGTATGVLMILQESGGGTNWTDIWISEIFTGTGIQRMPAIPVAGRRRWRAFNVGGTSTTVTVTITALELPTGSFPLMRQFRDLYAAATSFQSMTNNAAQVASTMVLSTLNSVSSTANIEGCKNVTAFAVFIGGTPTTAPVITLMFSMDGTNWFTSTNTFTPTAAGVFGVSISNNAWKYAQLKVTTAMAGGTNYTLGAVGINGVN